MLLYTQTIEDPRQTRQFEDIYTACRGRLLALARRKLCGGAEAEDAVHQAFLALAEHFPRLCRLPRPQLEAYLVVVTERKCIDCLRQQARRDGAPFDETAALVTPPPCGEPVADAMGRLSPRYREALLLRYGCGYSARETAALMDMSYGAGQKLQQRAKAALRQELEKEGLTV
ncbi:MAG: sigma-70 family RNA polymerase sigma factor [Firmicutes bacterium]|nr:sigma-70 family RNA polymerase sigma factor [Bacillota bacterium]MCI6387023.1 sigma-70 family RNA polymerase sigma factor [Bacillota bacterium]